MFNFLNRLRIEPEALYAYMSRLPKQIEVRWYKQDGLFVGEVKYDNSSFVTQGASHEEFIRMVSESVLVSEDIPPQYVDYLSSNPIFKPSQAELEDLRNNNTGVFRIVSNLKKARAYA